MFGRSHISDDQSGLRVWIYSAPNEAELVEYFVGSDPGAPVQCTDVRIMTNGVTQAFSYTRIDTPPVALHSRSIQYSVTQDDSTTHHVAVTAVNGTVAARVTLSTTDLADQAMTDAVFNLARLATS
ncbi:hypothetical protein IWX75_000049 [Arthrobacter sp. CAN_A6]|uniref:hypothetical protein n=1 Tax=Arthrobacter sp. CAN_A6 TaxID=2787721 RepID=UPI0018CA6A1E